MVRTVRVLGLTIALLGVAGAAAWANGAGTPAEASASDTVARTVERAADRVERRRACRPVPVAPLIDGAPSTALLETLGVLRREQTAEERAATGDGAFGFGSTYRDYVRIARSASGRAYVIEPGRATGIYRPRSRACRRAFRRLVARAVADRPLAFRRRAGRALDRTIRFLWQRPRAVREQVLTSDYRPDDHLGSGGGGSDAREIRRRGMFRATQLSRRSRAVLSGVVPDGVASIDFVFARRGSRGRGRPPVRYPSVLRRSEPVQDNVVGFVVARRAEDAFPLRMVWRAADGRIVRVVEIEGSYFVVSRRRAHATTSR